jgi:orotate phosphoribosyltransferase
MTDDILKTLPARRGHFLLESGCHTDLWLDLDALFVSPRDIAPHVVALAALLEPYSPTAVCGPLMGGAFLAHALAAHMGLRFYHTQPAPHANDGGLNDGELFNAQYRLPPELRRRVGGERVAVVDDCVSAGSSVRATAEELTAAGARVSAVGAILLLGDKAAAHFSAREVPLVALARQEFNLWMPAECPLCRAGAAAPEDPVASTLP